MISISTGIPSITASAGPIAPAMQVTQGQTAAEGAAFSVAFAQLVARLGLPLAPMQLLGAFPLDGTVSPAAGKPAGKAGAEAGDATVPDRLTMELLAMLAQDPTWAQRLLVQQSPLTQSNGQPSLTVVAVGGEASAPLTVAAAGGKAPAPLTVVAAGGKAPASMASATSLGAQAAQQVASVAGQPGAVAIAVGKDARAVNVTATVGTPAADAGHAVQPAKPNDLGGAPGGAGGASLRQEIGSGTAPAASYVAAAVRAVRANEEGAAAPAFVALQVEPTKTAAGKETTSGEVLLPFGVANSTVAAREVTAQAVSEPVVLSSLETKGWQEIANRIQMTFVNGRTEARIHLWPPELGRIEVRLVVDGQQVGVHLGANSAKAQDLIQANIPQLRTALMEQGLKVGDLSVTLDQFGLANQSMAQHGQAGSWMAGHAMPTPWFDEEPDQQSTAGPATIGDMDLVGRRTNSLVDCQA